MPNLTTTCGSGSPEGVFPAMTGSTYTRWDGPPHLYIKESGSGSTGWVAVATGATVIPYTQIQDVTATNRLLGRSTAGAGDIEEIPCTSAGRAILDDADATAQRTTLGLGALATLATVGSTQIDNDSVTYAKIQNVTDARLLGRSAGSAGDAQEITVGSGLSLSAGALTATGGGGGVSQMIVPLISDGAGITWTNMPAAVTFFGGSHRFATKVNLTDYTDCRLILNKQGVAGAAASIVRLRYITAFNTTVGNWLQIGASSVQVAVNVQNTVLDSGWIALAAGAKADVFITLDGSGGDGVLDPVYGGIVAQFR